MTHTTTPKVDLARMTEQERKSYKEGMAIVRKKLAASHKETPTELAARSMREGQRLVLHKLATARVEKTLAQPAIAAMLERVVSEAVKQFKAPAPKRKPEPPPVRREYVSEGKRTMHHTFCRLFG